MPYGGDGEESDPGRTKGTNVGMFLEMIANVWCSILLLEEREDIQSQINSMHK